MYSETNMWMDESMMSLNTCNLLSSKANCPHGSNSMHSLPTEEGNDSRKEDQVQTEKEGRFRGIILGGIWVTCCNENIKRNQSANHSSFPPRSSNASERNVRDYHEFLEKPSLSYPVKSRGH